MHIALFGGSFNPPHLAHVLCALYAYTMSTADEVWVLPAATHPYGKALLPWEQRWQLCSAAFAGMSCVHLRDDELRNPSGTTYDLVTQLTTAYPQHQWSFVGGSDTKADMPQWHRGGELINLLSGIIAIPRQGYANSGEHALPAISSSHIRTQIQAGASVSTLVPIDVQVLITDNNWYTDA